jgi:hypothetical protein
LYNQVKGICKRDLDLAPIDRKADAIRTPLFCFATLENLPIPARP